MIDEFEDILWGLVPPSGMRLTRVFRNITERCPYCGRRLKYIVSLDLKPGEPALVLGRVFECSRHGFIRG
jgi:hypothetical protein